MTQRIHVSALIEWLVKAAIILVPLGIAWGTITRDVRALEVQKLDAQRFTNDSTRRESDHTILIRIDQRMTEVYCGSVPLSSRSGCR